MAVVLEELVLGHFVQYKLLGEQGSRIYPEMDLVRVKFASLFVRLLMTWLRHLDDGYHFLKGLVVPAR